ncbi:MAG: TonB family protein [Pseudomonadota bacterium]
MFDSSPIRLAVGVPLAMIITYVLFQTMRLLISQDYVEPDIDQARVIERITPQDENTDINRRQRAKPRRLNSADKPPPPPKLSTTKSQIDLPTPNIQGQAPTELNVNMRELSFDPVAISDRDAQPVRPPVPSYPSRAAERGTEGSCDVRFDVDVRGRPYNIEADCTDRVFKREAERAVSRVEFAPKIVRGQAAERRNVVYPLEFKLQD